jgi:hypothetical protein
MDNNIQQNVVEQPIIAFEQDFEDIKMQSNVIWFKYEEKIRKIINGLSYWKNFDGEELIQQAYIYFIELAKIYDPYYNGNFIPFDKFLFKNLIIKFSGETPCRMHQLEVYMAIFCLEYGINPNDIDAELRIYQSDERYIHEPKREEILRIMDRIVSADRRIEKKKIGE